MAAGFQHLAAGLSEAEARGPGAMRRHELHEIPVEQRRRFGFTPDLRARARAPEAAGSARAAALVCARRDPLRERRSRGADRRRRRRAALGAPLVRRDDPASSIARVRAETLVEPLWRGRGLEPEPYAGAFRGLYVDICAAELPLGAAARGERRASVRSEPGRARRPRGSAELEQPLVYVTLGTVYNDPRCFRRAARGARRAGARSSPSAGASIRRTLGPVPARVRVERFVPQAHVLPSCAAVLYPRRLGNDARRARAGRAAVLVPQASRPVRQRGPLRGGGRGDRRRPTSSRGRVRAGLRRLLAEPSFRVQRRRSPRRSRRCRPPPRPPRRSSSSSCGARLARVTPRVRVAVVAQPSPSLQSPR